MRFIYTVLVLLFCTTIHAQDTYTRLKIHLSPEQNIQSLGDLGFEVDHGVWEKHQYFINDFSMREKAIIEQAGFEVETLIKDVQAYYLSPANKGVEKSSNSCGRYVEYEYGQPDNFRLGTMAGYYRYEEMLEELDEMRTRFPNLITARSPIGAILTHQGNLIYWLKIGSDRFAAEDKPEVLYTALHHAREPLSLTQMIYFMWYALENYGTDPEITYLLDHVDLYFIPCVNPDGYLHNEITNPQGGGLWRKNLRDNNEDGNIDFSDGVDLNRNYGYKWGNAYNGSSGNFSSQVYRGIDAFSEPETQAVAELCKQHQFKIAMNYHSHGNLLIYPWSYSDQPTEDAPAFNVITKAMTRENQYLAGTPSQTVGYVVNGDADDWMYGEQTEKNKILAMTPEVGYAFWVNERDIEFFCQQNILQNLMTAHLATAYAKIQEESDFYINQAENELLVKIQNIGLETGDFTVEARAIDGTTFGLDEGRVAVDELAPLEDRYVRIPYEVGLDEKDIAIQIKVSNAQGFVQTFQIEKQVKDIAVAVEELGNSIDQWDAYLWDVTSEDFYSSSTSITDSPNAPYRPSIYQRITLNPPVDLTNATEARLSFFAKWALEPRYDNVQLQLSFNYEEFFPVCGQHTLVARGGRWQGQDVYNGFQDDWVQEEIDLTPFIKEALSDADRAELRIQFVLSTDGATQEDGFYFDDLKIVTAEDLASNTEDLLLTENQISVSPNPSNEFIIIKTNDLQAQDELVVYDLLGRVVHTNIQNKQTQIDIADWQSGIYFCEWRRQGTVLGTSRLVKQ